MSQLFSYKLTSLSIQSGVSFFFGFISSMFSFFSVSVLWCFSALVFQFSRVSAPQCFHDPVFLFSSESVLQSLNSKCFQFSVPKFFSSYVFQFQGVSVIQCFTFQVLQMAGGDGGSLQGVCLYLHPAGLSRSRRGIFETYIRREGGRCVGVGQEGVVLLEDKLLEEERREVVLRGLGGREVVGLSWLSKCIEEGRMVGREGHWLAGGEEGGEMKRKLHELSDADDDDVTDIKDKKKQRTEKKVKKDTNKAHQLSDS